MEGNFANILRGTSDDGYDELLDKCATAVRTGNVEAMQVILATDSEYNPSERVYYAKDVLFELLCRELRRIKQSG